MYIGSKYKYCSDYILIVLDITFGTHKLKVLVDGCHRKKGGSFMKSLNFADLTNLCGIVCMCYNYIISSIMFF